MNINRSFILVLSTFFGIVVAAWGLSDRDASAQSASQKKSVIDAGIMQTLTNDAGVPISVAVADDRYVYVSALHLSIWKRGLL
ncbi:MAG: hypothetical protein GY789_15025 [Hyphomicrobiales bacterium]|nr:hypothetical protein [Hyphomicrobiales bacterium]